MTRLIIFIVSGMLWVSAALAGELITCFTPGEKCTDLIVKQIDEAKKSIYGGWVNPFEPINKGRLGST